MSTGEYGSVFVPDDLLVMQEPDLQQTIENFTSEFGGMPYVGGFDARDEPKRFGPICTRITRNRRLGVTFAALFHVTWLGGAVAIESSTIAPFRVQFDSVRWICNHEPRLPIAKQPGYSFCTRGIAAEHTMRTELPKISRARHRRFWQGRCGVGSLIIFQGQNLSICPGSNPVSDRSKSDS